MSAELISAVAGGLLSLALSYIPGLNTYWNELEGQHKRAWMAVLILAAAAGAYLGACQGWWNGSCGNWQLYLEAALAALVANQSIYKLTKG